MRASNETPRRMLTQAAAAKYCGVCVPTFKRTCPVRPTQLANGLARYDTRLIDRWLDSMSGIEAGENPLDADEMLEKAYAGVTRDRKRRSRARNSTVCE